MAIALKNMIGIMPIGKKNKHLVPQLEKRNQQMTESGELTKLEQKTLERLILEDS